MDTQTSHTTAVTPPGALESSLISRYHAGWQNTTTLATDDSAPPADWPWLAGRDLSWREYDWLARSGELYEAAPGIAFSSNENPSPAARAAAVKCLAPYNGVIARITAAWVWGCGPHAMPPVYLAGSHRSYRTAQARYIRSDLPAEHYCTFGPSKVTTPSRTAFDIARTDHTLAGDQALFELLTHHTSYERVIEIAKSLGKQRFPRQAMRRIQMLASLTHHNGSPTNPPGVSASSRH